MGRENKTRLVEEVFASRKAEWYAKDAGRETLREIGEMIAQAGPGRPCGGNAY